MGAGGRSRACGGKSKEADEVTKDHRYLAKAYSISIVDWWHVSKVYAGWVALGLIGVSVAVLWQPLVVPAYAEVANMTKVRAALNEPLVWTMLVLVLMSIYTLTPSGKAPVYMMDFAVFEPPADWACSHDDLIEICSRHGKFSEETLAFMRRILDRSKTGQATHWPPGTVRLLRGEATADCSMEAAREEARTVIFSCVDDALKRTGLKPRDIDFLIVNCSLFVPTPSLAAMVHSHYKLRADCRTYNLGGMGCSASVIGVDLARQLLEASPGSRALIVSTENLTQQLYLGGDRSMLVQNMLFRCGGAAAVLSSRATDGFRAKYKLLLTNRTQTSDDAALSCVWQCEDDSGKRGIRLSKEVPAIAGRALKHNLTAIGPYVLPLREQFAVLVREALRWAHTRATALGETLAIPALADLARPKPYIPNFRKGVDHFCIHAGGRAVIDGVAENLKLSRADTAPSRACLWHYGNTSSSSIWYELRFCEQESEAWVAEDAGAPVRAGDRVLQVAFGSGFKCNSAVWLRMR